MRKKQKKKGFDLSKTIFLTTVFTILLCTLYMMSVTYVRSYNLSVSMEGQTLESENATLKNKISELQQEIDDLKKEKSSEATQYSSFYKNDQNITVFASGND